MMIKQQPTQGGMMATIELMIFLNLLVTIYIAYKIYK